MATRVLFFGDSPHRIGGAQKSLLAALERIAEHGIQPTLVFPGGGPFEALCRARGVDVRVIDAGPAFRSYGKALLRLSRTQLVRVAVTDLARTSRDVARLAEKLGAAALHFNTPRGVIMAGGAAQLARLPSVLHLRGVPGLGRAVWLAAQLLADSYVVVARRLLEALAPSARPRATVVYNGIDAPPPIENAAARAALVAWLAGRGRVVDPTTRWVVSLSAPVPFKGLHHLVDAAHRLATTGKHRITWILAGEGLGDDYERWLERRVVELGLGESVSFIGHVDEVHRWLCAADLFVLTSVTGETVSFDGQSVHVGGEEGLPRSVLESLAAGTPIVATDGGGVREEIDAGVTGLVIPPSDPAALAQAIDEVLSDPAWQDRARELGPGVVRERFSVTGAARGLADALRSASSGRALWASRARNAVGLALDFVKNP